MLNPTQSTSPTMNKQTSTYLEQQHVVCSYYLMSCTSGCQLDLMVMASVISTKLLYAEPVKGTLRCRLSHTFFVLV